MNDFERWSRQAAKTGKPVHVAGLIFMPPPSTPRPPAPPPPPPVK